MESGDEVEGGGGCAAADGSSFLAAAAAATITACPRLLIKSQQQAPWRAGIGRATRIAFRRVCVV